MLCQMVLLAGTSTMSHDLEFGKLISSVDHLAGEVERLTGMVGKLEDRLDQQDEIIQKGKGAFFLLSALGGLGLIVMELLQYIKGV